MRIFATRPTRSLTLRGAAAFAIAGAIVSTMATASFAETHRPHRGNAMTTEPYQGQTSDPSYFGRPSGQCLQDEGQGRFTPCDGSGAGG